MWKTLLLLGLFNFCLSISHLRAQEVGQEEYTYVTQSDDKTVTLKMINDELEHTGVKVLFFDQAGKEIGKWEQKDTSSDSWSLSPGGKYFQCQIFRRLTSSDPYTREVVVIDNTGKELFSYKSSGDVGRWSPADDYIVVHDRGFTAVRAYDMNGKMLWERKKTKSAKELSLAEISRNGKYLALGEYPKSLLLISKDGKELYRKDFEIIPGKFKRANILVGGIDDDGNVLVHPGSDSEIRVLDRKGGVKFSNHFAEYDRFVVVFSSANPNELEITNRKQKTEKRRLKWR